jgi:hypothetical protein
MIEEVDFGDVKFQSYDLESFATSYLEKAKIKPTEESVNYLVECYKMFPPVLSKDITPPWFKEGHPLRKCHGINKIIHSGYIIRAPFDVACAHFLVDSFPDRFLEDFPVEQRELGTVFKFVTPWMIKSSKKWDVMFIQPAYHFRGGVGYRIQSGLLSIDKREAYKAGIKRGDKLKDWEDDPFGEQINPLFTVDKHKSAEEVIFKQGYPILQMIVVKR